MPLHGHVRLRSFDIPKAAAVAIPRPCGCSAGRWLRATYGVRRDWPSLIVFQCRCGVTWTLETG